MASQASSERDNAASSLNRDESAVGLRSADSGVPPAELPAPEVPEPEAGAVGADGAGAGEPSHPSAGAPVAAAATGTELMRTAGAVCCWRLIVAGADAGTAAGSGAVRPCAAATDFPAITCAARTDDAG